MGTALIITNSLAESIATAEASFCRNVRHSDPRETVALISAHPELLYQLIKPYLAAYQEPKVLELGSGNGFQLCDLLLRGIDAFGVEPGEFSSFVGRYERCRELLRENNVDEARVKQSPAECLPFADESFDIVSSADVIEHVADIEKVLAESYRVLRPGGVMVMAMPNFDCYREGHYNLLWLPYLFKNKRLAKLYVSLRGRDASYIDTLNFTTPRLLTKLCAGRAVQVSLHGSGQLARLTETYNFLKEARAKGYRFKRPRLAHMAMIATAIATHAMEITGLIRSFTVIVKK
jgi:SAM-dependent methyltransferase